MQFKPKPESSSPVIFPARKRNLGIVFDELGLIPSLYFSPTFNDVIQTMNVLICKFLNGCFSLTINNLPDNLESIVKKPEIQNTNEESLQIVSVM